jgi:hypothetical protein
VCCVFYITRSSLENTLISIADEKDFHIFAYKHSIIAAGGAAGTGSDRFFHFLLQWKWRENLFDSGQHALLCVDV